jgi:predicted transcriptional regulator of viral defense system
VHEGYDLDKFIEKSLQNIPVVDYATLKSILSESGYKYINDKIKYMKQKGLLTSLKKGLYLYNSPYINTLASKEIIANNLLGPSYISYEYALYYHGLTPEKVVEVTSATTKRSKVFKTAVGIFSYRHINKELYALGLKIEKSAQGNFMIASPIKALCDKVYATKGVKITSKKAMMTFLSDDLRIDLDELVGVDLSEAKEYAHISNSKRVEFLYKVLEDINR